MRSLPEYLRSPLAAGALIDVLISLATLGLRALGLIESLEFAAYDLCMRLRADDSGADSRIVLITVTEDDIRKIGQWPLTDEILAQPLEIPSRSQPRAIGVDIYRDIPVPLSRRDERLATACFTRTPSFARDALSFNSHC